MKCGLLGNATGAHLHFEIFKDGKRINPKPYIDSNLYLENIGLPVKRNVKETQIEVIVSNLRLRKSPFGEVIGFCNKRNI